MLHMVGEKWEYSLHDIGYEMANYTYHTYFSELMQPRG